jgi:hypothetical protein
LHLVVTGGGEIAQATIPSSGAALVFVTLPVIGSAATAEPAHSKAAITPTTIVNAPSRAFPMPLAPSRPVVFA